MGQFFVLLVGEHLLVHFDLELQRAVDCLKFDLQLADFLEVQRVAAL
jgi:hypothetical protein